MITLRELEFLASLARRKHFARAAEECGVSQPAFSMGIRKIEEKLGAALVKRGNRFQGFTQEGEMLVRHAHKILDDLRGMEQELRAARGEITGHLALGAIPTATIHAARLTKALQEAHPGIQVSLEEATSLAIQHGVEHGRFDAGITYRDGVPADLMRADRLYRETYLALVPEHLSRGLRDTIPWAELAELPLCLLQPDMQNRRILDHVFGEKGLVPQVRCETSGFTAAMVLAAEGTMATIVPRLLLETLGGVTGAVALEPVEPRLEKEVCLVTPKRDPSLPTVAALRAVCLDPS